MNVKCISFPCKFTSFVGEMCSREHTTNAFTQVALWYCASAFPAFPVVVFAVGYFPGPTALNYYSWEL